MRGRICLAGPGAVQASTKVHVGYRTRIPFIFGKNAINPKRIAAVNRFRKRPYVAGAPTFGFGNDVADARAFEDTRVPALQPMVVPCQRLNMETLPRPR